MSMSEKPQDAAPKASRSVIWRSVAEKAVADLQWRLDRAVELANERQAEIDAMKLHVVGSDRLPKCDGCGGLFPREATTEKDGARFCDGCIEESKQAKQIRNQAELIKTLEARIRVLSQQLADQSKANESERIWLKAELAKAKDAIAVWQNRFRDLEGVIDEHSEQRIKALQGQVALLKVKAAAAPLQEAKADSRQTPAESVACWYRAAVPSGWSAGWLLVDGPLKVVAMQNGHVRWCHPSNVTTTEPEEA